MLPMSKGLGKTLSRYLRKGRSKLRPERGEEALFIAAQTGRRMSPQSLYLKVRKMGAEADIKLKAHTLRHACATHLLEGGADIRYVQELLGHADITSTQIYTKISPIELHKIFRRTHPRARRRD